MDNLEEGLKVGRVIERLRKPEVRSEFNQELLQKFAIYFEEVLNTQNPPESVVKFNQNKGVIFPAGSILRGTARIGSDLDLFLVYDSSISNPSGPFTGFGSRDVEEMASDFKNIHSSKVRFGVWFANQLKNDPMLQHYYEEGKEFRKKVIEQENIHYPTRKKEFKEEDLQHRIITSEEEHGFDTGYLESETSRFIPFTPDSLDRSTLKDHRDPRAKDAIDFGLYREKMHLITPTLLTITSDYAVSKDPRSLLYQQQKLVKILLLLEQENPDLFNKIYQGIRANFQGIVTWEGSNHPHSRSFNSLIRDYLKTSNRFGENNIARATGLIKATRGQIKFPPLQAFKEYFEVH